MKQLHSRLLAIEILIGVCAQRADDLGLVRENTECARIGVAHILRDLEYFGIEAS